MKKICVALCLLSLSGCSLLPEQNKDEFKALAAKQLAEHKVNHYQTKVLLNATQLDYAKKNLKQSKDELEQKELELMDKLGFDVE